MFVYLQQTVAYQTPLIWYAIGGFSALLFWGFKQYFA